MKGRKAGRATLRGREVTPREMAEKGGLGQRVATRATRRAEAEEEKGQTWHDEGEPALDRKREEPEHRREDTKNNKNKIGNCHKEASAGRQRCENSKASQGNQMGCKGSGNEHGGEKE